MSETVVLRLVGAATLVGHAQTQGAAKVNGCVGGYGPVVTTASEAAVAESPGAHPGQLGADCAPCAGYACPGRGRARRDGCELAG